MLQAVHLHPSFGPKCTHTYALSRSGARRLLLHLRHPPFAYSWALHILPGESDTKLKNSNVFTCHASNHLFSYPRSKLMSNDPSLDLDHHVPQHTVQFRSICHLGQIFKKFQPQIIDWAWNLGSNLIFWPLCDVWLTNWLKLYSILQSVGSIYNLEGCHIAGCTLKDMLFNIHIWSLFSVQVFRNI